MSMRFPHDRRPAVPKAALSTEERASPPHSFRTFRPTVAAESCLHCSGASCSRCADVCPEGIDLHHPEASVSLAECTKCGECRDACPAHAISFPLLARTEKAGLPVASVAQEADEDAVGAEG